ncbi:MAG: aldehyde dehydrogenase family protein [Planctomycetaceae bacterium]
MSATATEIQALTARQFTTPTKFTAFCNNGGKPLGGVIDGASVSGSMNATFETIDPGSGEVLARICEMGDAEVARAVEAATRAFHGDGVRGWRDFDVEDRIELVNKLVELCERDRDVLLACEIRDGGKVSELAEGDFDQIRAPPITSAASLATSRSATARRWRSARINAASPTASLGASSRASSPGTTRSS